MGLYLTIGCLWGEESDMDKLEEHMRKFFEDYSMKLEQCTLKYIQFNVEELIAHSKKTLQDIHAKDIRNWMAHLHSKGYVQITLNTKFFRVKRFFQYCSEEGILIHNPFQFIPNPNPDYNQKLPRYLEMEQLTQLRQLVAGQVLQRTVIEVLYSTGVRVSELCGMMIEDINWSERSIHIKKGKNKRERNVLFTKECTEYLNKYLQGRTDELPFLFLNRRENGPITRYTIGDWFKEYSKKLGIKVSAHILRHTFATHLAIKGMRLEYIQALLGHEEPRNTQIYTRLYEHAKKELYDEWM